MSAGSIVGESISNSGTRCPPTAVYVYVVGPGVFAPAEWPLAWFSFEGNNDVEEVPHVCCGRRSGITYAPFFSIWTASPALFRTHAENLKAEQRGAVRGSGLPHIRNTVRRHLHPWVFQAVSTALPSTGKRCHAKAPGSVFGIDGNQRHLRKVRWGGRIFRKKKQRIWQPPF